LRYAQFDLDQAKASGDQTKVAQAQTLVNAISNHTAPAAAPKPSFIDSGVLSDLSTAAKAAPPSDWDNNTPAPALNTQPALQSPSSTSMFPTDSMGAQAVPALVGGLEAGANAVTGALAPALGVPAGIANSLYHSIKGDGPKFGTPEAATAAEDTAARIAQQFTYQPRTPAGQSMSAGLGNLVNDSGIVAVAPDLSAAHALGSGLGAISDANAAPVASNTRTEPYIGTPKPTRTCRTS
jgi:hypothetical protein